MVEKESMPKTQAPASTPDTLQDLTQLVQTTEGFGFVLESVRAGHGGVIDGAWGSAAGLVASALGLHCSGTLLVGLAHPADVDGWTEDIATFSGTRPAVFPAWDTTPADSKLVDEVASQRHRVLKSLSSSQPPRFLLTTIQALIQPVPPPAVFRERRLELKVGDGRGPEEVAKWLVDNGYDRSETVELPGDFSRRGGIIDFYSPDADNPVRLEFFGDEIESIRHFSLESQRSLASLTRVEALALNLERAAGLPAAMPRLRPGEKAKAVALPGDGQPTGPPLTGHLCDYLPKGSWTVLCEAEELEEQGRHFLERSPDPRGLFSVAGAFQQLLRMPSIRLSALPTSTVEAICHLRVESVERFSGAVARLGEELDGLPAADRVLIACHNEAEKKRLGQILAGGPQSRTDRLRLVLGRVREGFRILAPGAGLRPDLGSETRQLKSTDIGIVVLGDHELFHREEYRPVAPRRRVESRAIDSFLDLVEGELVVHVTHGIARYLGMQVLEKNGRTEEHLILEFRDTVRVYVPASKIDLVQKYVGGSKTDPELSRFGGRGWQRKKERVEAAVLDLASEMVELQALREAQPGIAYGPDSEWQAEFEAAFGYQETPDQLTTLVEVKEDLEKGRPMDRLICGDVGYGKTELAIRAAFKVMDNGKQVAVLVPTTVLAEQHFRTFSQRLAEYPFVVDSISRFRSPAEQKRIIERLGQGGIDIIIGTHRLVSPDIQFKDLGLVIIDEEQRFGVEHKERLKKLRQMVDVLTMTATPIPRTLHLALLGIRNISNLETPPPDRLAIETRIARFDPQLIRYAILRELNREGQVFFVHNRVHNIKEIAQKVLDIVPEATVAVAHGQMPEHELEQAMLQFVRRECDILVATTIIESGLDIPNANTIFINQADIYGLADLHQLRGRVGRYKHRAYAYLLLDSDRSVTPTATRRLKAIEEFTELGAGFKIALRDLEIRGAGNILGTQQSGHIAAVGYELYCQLLENAVRQLKNQPIRVPLEVTVDLPWKAYLPRDYVPGQKLRIEVYRRLGRIRRAERLADFQKEMRDRFGPIPHPVEWLFRQAEIRLLATRWQIVAVHLEKPAEKFMVPTDLVLQYRNARKMRRLADRARGRLRVVDGESAYFRLHMDELDAQVLYASLKDLLRWP
jgi:transcription-repair coupling factor (superfamily II helicase)